MTRGWPARLGIALVLTLAAAAALLGGPPAARANGRARAPSSGWAKTARAEIPDRVVDLNPGIFPVERRTVRFEHRVHGARAGLRCVDCHPDATSSRRASDLLLPAGIACDRCHQTDHHDPLRAPAPAETVAGTCGRCHELVAGELDRIAPQRYPQPNLRFDHGAHAARNIHCAQGHLGVANGRAEGRAGLPSMRRCATCHLAPRSARGDAPARCQTCHLTRGGRLRTSFGGVPLLPPRWLGHAEHGPGFAEHHAEAAGTDSRFCANCHAESECAACHDGRRSPPALHPNDWLSLHGRAATLGSPRCESCHRRQSFCLGCHQRLGVAATGPTSATARRGRHPPAPAIWTDPPRTRAHHASAAQRNLEACIGCHVERDCVACHATAPGRRRRGNRPPSQPPLPRLLPKLRRRVPQEPPALLGVPRP
jgi:hypothetical protein